MSSRPFVFFMFFLFFAFSCSTSSRNVSSFVSLEGMERKADNSVLRGVDYHTIYESRYLKYAFSKQMFLEEEEDEEVLEIDRKGVLLKGKGDDFVYVSRIPELSTSSDRFFIVYFDFDSAVLREDQATPLKSFVDGVLKREKNFKKVRILLGGYTDEVGSFDYNFRLGYMRALSVKRFLEDYLEGVDVDFIVYSKGKCCFISKDSAKNRRVEVEVYTY